MNDKVGKCYDVIVLASAFLNARKQVKRFRSMRKPKYVDTYFSLCEECVSKAKTLPPMLCQSFLYLIKE